VNRCESELNITTTSSQCVVNQLVVNEGKYVCLPEKYQKNHKSHYGRRVTKQHDYPDGRRHIRAHISNYYK